MVLIEIICFLKIIYVYLQILIYGNIIKSNT